MKIALSLAVIALAVAPASAQVFRPGVANSRGPVHHDSRGYHGSHGHYIWAPSYGVRFGYYPAYGYYDGYGAGYPYYGGYDYGAYGGSGAGTGLLLGALAGGIIGNNSGDFRHSGWRGAAWGAGVGWLLGSIADANRRTVSYQRPVVVASPPVAATQPVAQPAAQPVTIINNYYGTTPMTTANALFGR